MHTKVQTVAFGRKTVERAEKHGMVNDVFSSVADRYDLMNDLMSFAIHRLWKNFAVKLHLVPAHPVHILDLAAGTGDMSLRIAANLHQDSHLVMADSNIEMMQAGRRRLLDAGITTVPYVICDAETLPFASASFDRVIMAFGLRNLTDIHQGLKEIYRVLKPGGIVVILEFSKPSKWIQNIYDRYSFHIIPELGRHFAKDTESYQYLVESIRIHPNQQKLQSLMETNGFELCSWVNLSSGICTLHRGCKCRL